MKTKIWEDLEASVKANAIDPILKNSPVVAIMSGTPIVIEAILYRASKASGIPMDWGYVGGRAIVHADGNAAKAVAAIQEAMPKILT